MNALRDRVSALLRRLGATRDPASLGDALLTAWSEPARSYHDLRHLQDCLRQLDGLSVRGATRDLVELALWFHDAKYHPGSADNEEQSARWAAEALPALGISSDVADEVVRLVLLTRDHAPVGDEAGRLMCDIDLSILGRPVEAFDAYERRIRAEYALVPEQAYRQGRGRILAGFLRREPLFQTETFRRRFESSARANLRRALAALDSGT
jgi:predicted metal-dependent HD superfamily phosphohydrolase